MNISQIEYVLAVDRLKSFNQAADSCFITQSTLSAMVAKFEREIEITIFNRKTNPVSTTREGQVIIERLKSISKEFETLDETIQHLKGTVTGNVQIAGIPTVAPNLFPLILSDFTNKYPDIKFVIHELTTQKIIEGMRNREIDIGIVSTPLEEKSLIEHPVYQEQFMIYDLGDTTGKRKKRTINISDIDYRRLLLLEEGHCLRNQVESICKLRKSKDLYSNLIYKSGTMETLKKFVALNQGVTLLPYLTALDLPDEHKGYLQYLAEPTPVREIGVIVHENFVKKVVLKDLIAIIQSKVKPLLKLPSDPVVINPF